MKRAAALSTLPALIASGCLWTTPVPKPHLIPCATRILVIQSASQCRRHCAIFKRLVNGNGCSAFTPLHPCIFCCISIIIITIIIITTVIIISTQCAAAPNFPSRISLCTFVCLYVCRAVLKCLHRKCLCNFTVIEYFH